MKDKNTSSCRFRCIVATALFTFFCLMAAPTGASALEEPIGPGKVVVHPKFGGGIFGFDIDQNGTEGVLTESQTLSNGNVLSAVETFDQKTGKILKVISKTETQDDDITLGVVGASVGLIEHEHVGSNGFVDKRAYHLLNPLSSNRYTGLWTPALDAKHIVFGVSRSQGTPTNAFFVIDNLGTGAKSYVFGSDVAKNSFGPMVQMTDPNFEPYLTPALALDTKTNTAVLAGDVGSPTDIPDIGMVNLSTGKFSHFQIDVGGSGSVNGLAVDSEDRIACTTTQADASIEFYDLKKRTGFSVVLPGGQTGADVEFDPIHKLFLIAQPVSGTGQGSSIQVYDVKGNLVESLNGFSFSNRFTVIPLYIGLNPKLRSGFVPDQANQNVPGDLRSFTY